MKHILCLTLALAGIARAAAPDYALHEWGTFTTVAGSDGVLLAGLQREEEHLPSFSYSHFGMENGSRMDPAAMEQMNKRHGRWQFASENQFTKGLGRRPVTGVTVKMETPVIYFHSPEAFHAKVSVGFNGGTISQWYPQRSGGETLPDPTPSANPKENPTPLKDFTIDFAKPYRGAIAWDIDVLSPAQSKEAILFKPTDTMNWLRARVPEANAVRTANGETEGYLFYRGIGNFAIDLKTTVSQDETLHLSNSGVGTIPFLLVFDKRGADIRWRAIDGLAGSAQTQITEDSLTLTRDAFPEKIYQTLTDGLAKCGLTRSEARAMAETWWASYFQADGLRVFWVLPQPSVDRILPLEVTPAPRETVRVIVGRSEVLRPSQEREWQARLSGPKPDEVAMWRNQLAIDRFGMAVTQRLEDLCRVSATTQPPATPAAQ